MYFKATVRVWRDKRDSSNRINKLDKSKVGYREFILNPERIVNLLPLVANGSSLTFDSTDFSWDSLFYSFDQLSTSANTGAKFWYSDNAIGRKESLSYLEVTESVDFIKSAIDTPFDSKFYTLPVHIHNDPTKPTYSLTIQANSLVYADRYNPYTGNKVWVVFMETVFKRVEVLCDMSFEEMMGYTGIMTFDRDDITWDSILVTFDQI
jgi:hypothetical protein